MTNIYVSPLSRLPAMIELVSPSHIITLLSPERMIDEISGVNHYRVGIHDYHGGMVHGRTIIGEPTIPNIKHVEGIIQYLEQWNRNGNILIHCWAGISRSTATALIALLLHKKISEMDAALAIRNSSAAAAPNPLLIQFADEVLGKQGRLIKAVSEMSKAYPANENDPFCLNL